MPELVALDLPGGMGFVDALRAIWDTGDAAAPLDPRLPDVARKAMLDALRPTRIVGSDGEQHALPHGMPVEDGDALVVTTSGTSGQPKGVVLTHDAVAASARATTARLGVDPSRHSWLACLPLAHIGGLSVVSRALVTGTPLTVMPSFAAEAVSAAGRAGRATHVALVATALRRVDAALFTCVLLGGSKAPDGLPSNVVTTYGMTESGSGIVYDGFALDGVELALRPLRGSGSVDDPPRANASSRDAFSDTSRDDAFSGISRGDVSEGEVLVRAPMLFRHYRDGGDGRVVGPDGAADWYATGDAGRFDLDGRLHVSGRIEDVITTGAEKVWPDQVERVLMAHPDVAEVAVWKRADPEWGERVVAWVVPSDDAPSLDALRQIVADTIAPWAAPKELVLVDDLPRTAAGKVRRRELESFGG